jgi:hypothetical protein
MCVAGPGQIWTGSSRGSIRIWTLATSPSPTRSLAKGVDPEQPQCRELRRAAGERPHGGAVAGLECTADGQLVWSVAGKSALLWDAASGQYMGALQRPGGKKGGLASASAADLAGFEGADPLAFLRINVSKVRLFTQIASLLSFFFLPAFNGEK